MSALQTLSTRWNALAPRERGLLQWAAAVLAGAALWFGMLGPALTTLRRADAQHATLNQQLQHMLALQAQARDIQAQPALAFDEAVRALQAATQKTLGDSAQVQVSGAQATITLRTASADALAQWLAQARLNARSVPLEAHITRAPSAVGSPAAAWNGVLIMSLPNR